MRLQLSKIMPEQPGDATRFPAIFRDTLESLAQTEYVLHIK